MNTFFNFIKTSGRVQNLKSEFEKIDMKRFFKEMKVKIQLEIEFYGKKKTVFYCSRIHFQATINVFLKFCCSNKEKH